MTTSDFMTYKKIYSRKSTCFLLLNNRLLDYGHSMDLELKEKGKF